MVEHSESVQSLEFLSHLQDHVLTPIETALERTADERTVVEDEREAFEAFADAVQSIDTERPANGTPAPAVRASPTGAAEVRTAYRETVMSVTGRQEETEQLVTELAAEFGEDIAAQLAPDSPTAFTDTLKQVIVAAADRGRSKRAILLDGLDGEREDLTAAQETLETLVANLDSSRVPSWYQSTVNERLETLADQRQTSLSRRRSKLKRDGHELCEYLYRDEAWTYPVLTAVTRVRRSMALPR